MKRTDKVRKVTKKNYAEVCKRAQELKNKLRQALKAGKGPSLHFMVEKWGFQMSDAALERHRKNVMTELGLRKTPKATQVLERKRHAVA